MAAEGCHDTAGRLRDVENAFDGSLRYRNRLCGMGAGAGLAMSRPRMPTSPTSQMPLKYIANAAANEVAITIQLNVRGRGPVAFRCDWARTPIAIRNGPRMKNQ